MVLMVKSDDLRVKRTRKLISQAFFTLLRKKKFEKISIQEIADSAMINRATFYAHYADKQDLYDSLIQNEVHLTPCESCSVVFSSATPGTIQSMGFSRPEY